MRYNTQARPAVLPTANYILCTNNIRVTSYTLHMKVMQRETSVVVLRHCEVTLAALVGLELNPFIDPLWRCFQAINTISHNFCFILQQLCTGTYFLIDIYIP